MDDPGITRTEAEGDATQIVVDRHRQRPSGHPRVLVTNDDGVDSPGLARLAHALSEHYEVTVAAPSQDQSGSGTAIGRFSSPPGVPLHRAELDHVSAYSVGGPPGLAVTAAALGGFGETPDLVVSGPNLGMNTGHSIIHSGTVGAVLTARTFQISGLAVSVAPSDPWVWETAARVAVSASRWLLERPERCLTLNVNIPPLPPEDVKGARWAALDEFGHFRVANADIESETLEFEVRGSGSGLDPASDTALCREGYVTFTPLDTVQPAPYPDVPAQDLWPRALADAEGAG